MDTTDNKLKLAFGRQTFPDTARAVWGARLIWPNDLLYDRQDLAARSDEDKMALMAWLNDDKAIGKALDALREPYSLGLSPSMDFHDEAVIYEDETGIIVGSAQGSHGYVYVAGWLKP